MKGQGNSVLYPQSSSLNLLCQSGDIYLDDGHDKVMEYVNRTYPTREVNELTSLLLFQGCGGGDPLQAVFYA